MFSAFGLVLNSWLSSKVEHQDPVQYLPWLHSVNCKVAGVPLFRRDSARLSRATPVRLGESPLAF